MMQAGTRSARERRRVRVGRKLRGTADRPRLSVYRSNAQIYAQLIDDDRGHTLVAASSLDGDVSGDGHKTDVARRVGEVVGDRARAAGITRVVFDRGGFRYAGRVKALAEGAREHGLEF
ncbi:MAG TPA: 50S ribosomal protein L18 [Nitriliruptorales bacterium]|nr:50S ribosomal protein L18 [Nitriliruptorales bacterium]